MIFNILYSMFRYISAYPVTITLRSTNNIFLAARNAQKSKGKVGSEIKRMLVYEMGQIFIPFVLVLFLFISFY